MECKDCQYSYYHANEDTVDFECDADGCPYNPPEPEVPGLLEFENPPVTCSSCGWVGFTNQLNGKQIINPKTLQDEGVPACPQCGSHTTLEY